MTIQHTQITQLPEDSGMASYHLGKEKGLLQTDIHLQDSYYTMLKHACEKLYFYATVDQQMAFRVAFLQVTIFSLFPDVKSLFFYKAQ